MTTIETASIHSLKPGYEPVLTVDDYYDGPRKGVAHFHGVPHYYECVFNESKDDYTEWYELTPLSPKAVDAARETWEIFQRWRSAFDSGETSLDTHPCLPEDTNKYRAAVRDFEAVLVSERSCVVRARGSFTVIDSEDKADVLRCWQVKWTDF